MDLTEALRGEDISRTDFFDFVVAPEVGDQSALHFNRALKSMGIFVEEAPAPAGAGMSPGGGGGHLPKETNNNHVDGGWSAAASERDAVRLETAILEDLNRFCWGDGAGAGCGGGSAGSTGSASPAHRAPGDTDGAIYTLTVLNGGEHACAWYRPPEGPPAPTATAPRTEARSEDPPPPPPPAFPAPPPVDIDSLLSSVPTAHSPHPPPPPCTTEPTAPLPPMPFPQRNGYAAGPSPPAPPRAPSPSAPGGESLLRSALQGRPFAPPPPPPPPPRFVAPDETPPFPSDPVDDLLLSQLDAASFPEDYEKLKRIAHEVAESVSQFCLELPRGGVYEEISPATAAAAAAAEAAAAAAAVTTGAARAKKSGGGAKRSGGAARAPGSTPGNGARKERSLHYCSICSKGFKDKYSVNVHIRTHTGEKPFACSLCGKSFRQKAHLAKHYQTHLASHKGSGGGGAGAVAGAAPGGGGAAGPPRRPPAPHRAS